VRLQAFGAGKAAQWRCTPKHGRNFHTQFALAFWSARGAPPFWIPVTELGIIGGIGFYKLGAPTALLLEQLRGTAFQQGDILPGVLMF